MWQFGYYIFFTNDYLWYGLYIIIYIQNMRFCARKPMGKWVNSNSVLLAPTSSFGQTKSARSILMILCRRCRSKATNLTKFPHRSPAIVMSCKKNRVVFQRCVYFFYFFKIEYVVSSLASFSIQDGFGGKIKKYTVYGWTNFTAPARRDISTTMWSRRVWIWLQPWVCGRIERKHHGMESKELT